jgi:5'-nucleotidase
MRRLMLALAALAALVLAAGQAGTAATPASEPQFWLTILHNNDGESRLLGAGSNDLADYGGIARFKTVVDNLRAEALAREGKNGVVLLSSGDNFLAGPQFNASLEKGPPFYDSIGLDAIGYDAMALGNHEFDFGPDILADFIGGFDARVPFLSANLDFSEEPALRALYRPLGFTLGPHIAKSTIVPEGGRLIGVVGATTPLLPAISSPRRVGVDPNVVGAIQGQVNWLQLIGVRHIILISHLQNVQEDLELIPQLRGVDVAIAGGGDELLANPGALLVPGDSIQGPYPTNAVDKDGETVPVVTTAGDYKYVGRLVVGFDRRGEVVEVDTAASGPVRVSGVAPDAVTPDPELQETVVEPVAAHVAALAANVIAQSAVPLEGRRGNAANPNATPPDLKGTPGVRRTETNLGNLMADALLWQGQQLAGNFGVVPPNVGLQNGGGIRNNSLIPAGNFTELNTFEIAAFSNFVSVVPDIPATQLKELLENAVSGMPGADGRFAQVAGLRFTYDVSAQAQVVDNAGTVLTPGSRIREVVLDDGTVIVQNGAVVAGAPAVAIATNDFSARGGDQYPFRGAPFTTLGVTYQQALSNYVQDGLGGQITAADYPAGGEGRIVCTDGNGAGVGPDCP